ncbi:hypothetical protein DJ71_21805 [Halorubrum sp. E3]|uniref:DUF7260 domain-containing protein n=1 Tax=Halorubrum persicum TaxID=1383844 RepID=A0A2G1WME2_9EURY|nr:hypothetical protein [Halorubrum persicum]OYR66989.1 hypothetical protein DJ71_21805 [Halorubrum sp. E3]PHQ40178.1 hypothetical protein DJ69_02365 [Halorubrum persicum]
MAPRLISVTTFRIADTDAAVAGCESLTCKLVEVVTNPSVVTGLMLTGLAALIALSYVRDATGKCRREKRRVLDERDAFSEFADRVAALDLGSVPSLTPDSGGPVRRFHRTTESGKPVSITLQRVISIYRETVMSVTHYEREYDETVSESLTAELGPDTVMSLAANKNLSPPAQNALVSRSREAADARDSLADAIEVELDALADVESELSTIDRRRRRLISHLDEVNVDETGAALDIWHQLNDLEIETEKVATERQRSLRNSPMQIDTGIVDTGEMAFYDYLYGSTDGPSHPVLAQIADLTAEIRDNRDHVATQIANGD